MAPKLYSGAYLTSFVDAILEKVSLILKDDSFPERKILLRKLEKSLYEARPVLDDAEQKQFTEEIVKKWLLDLQDALYMADDLVDELSTTKAAIPTTLRDPDTGDMEKIVGTLESVVAHKDLLCLEKSAKVDMPRTPSTSLVKLENVKNSGEASNARMDEKIHLNALELWWSSYEESEVCDSESEKDVLDKLRPHKDLKKLSIRCYRGTMFPDWVGQSSYHNMTWLELRGCRNCWVLPSLGQLPSLERLVIREFEKVKKIGGSFYKGNGTHQHQETPFRSLKSLEFHDMGWWEEWESYEYDDDDDAPFPKLETLEIWFCPKLRGDLPTFLPSLKSLEIASCEEVSCYLPRAPSILKLEIYGKQEARMRELPLSMLERLVINGEQHVEYVFEAMTHTQPTSLIDLHISECSSAISFPGDSLPPLLKQLRINNCKNVEFPMQNQQHESLTSLTIKNSCDSLTSLPAFPSLLSLRIERCENLTSLELSQSQSLRYLWIAECPKLKNIIRLPGSLIRLFIIKCGLLGEGIERKDPHIWPSISHIPQIYSLKL
ncbi:hypothetical protein AHAS_Ahas02G0251600 [Arachis hypogaea]